MPVPLQRGNLAGSCLSRSSLLVSFQVRHADCDASLTDCLRYLFVQTFETLAQVPALAAGPLRAVKGFSHIITDTASRGVLGGARPSMPGLFHPIPVVPARVPLHCVLVRMKKRKPGVVFKFCLLRGVIRMLRIVIIIMVPLGREWARGLRTAQIEASLTWSQRRGHR